MINTLKNSLNKTDTKNVWMIAVPVILGTLWDPIIGLIDTSVAGHFEVEYLWLRICWCRLYIPVTI